MLKGFLIVILPLIAASPVRLKAQVPGGFDYPLRIEPKLNANFGEMRPNHFHMGLDLFTLRRENLPVYAPADGYVSRVKIEAGGFGNALYLDHPNGTTTLYAHLNGFTPDLEAYLELEQYRQESWAVDIPIPRNRFKVQRGQFIGWSGNTGASAGPHVHFEVRETSTEKCLNPLRFGFNIPDRVPPDLFKLAVYDRNRSTYEQSPLIFPLKKTAAGWSTSGVIRVRTDKVTIALQATDRMSGTPNANGIFETRLFRGDALVGGFRLDSLGYDDTRYLNAHIDHAHRTSGGSYLQYLLPLPGDRSGLYRDARGAHHLPLDDTLRHDFRLEVRDVAGNLSVARFTLQRIGSPDATPPARAGRLHPGTYGIIETEELQVVLGDRALYDSVQPDVQRRPTTGTTAFSPAFDLLRPSIPIHEPFTIRIRPDRPIPEESRDRMLISKVTRGVRQVRKATPGKEGYAVTYRDAGSFRLESDLTPPVIQLYGLRDGANASGLHAIVVSVSDDNAAIGGFRAELDGAWLRFSRRGNTFTYRFDAHCPPGRHTLTLTAADEVGNKSTRSVVFHR